MLPRIRYLLKPMVRPIISLVESSLRRFIEDAIENKVQDRIRQVLRRIPISETLEEDVFIVGYPKSGNTWFQNLVAGVIYGVDPGYAPDTLIQELVPDVHYMKYYKRYRTPMFFKTHHLPRPDYRRVVYLLRDGRDVMVSYWHYLSALQGQEVDFLRMVRDGDGLFPSKWHEHVDAWLANPYEAEMIIIRYEDLKEDCVRELRRFCEFVGIHRTASLLERVAEQASFVSIRKKIDKGEYFQENLKWPKDKPFFRRGIVGSYRDEMPADVLKAFLIDAEQTLRRCCYM